MDKKELIRILELLVGRFRSNEDELLDYKALPEEEQPAIGLDEWLEIQDFVADAIEEKIDREPL